MGYHFVHIHGQHLLHHIIQVRVPLLGSDYSSGDRANFTNSDSSCYKDYQYSMIRLNLLKFKAMTHLSRGHCRPGNRSEMRPRKRGTSSKTNFGRFISLRPRINTTSFW